MGDENQSVTKLDYDAIEKFIKEIKADAPCPTCGHDVWLLEGARVGTEVQLQFASVIESNNTKVFNTNAIACFALICNTCGYVKTYAKSIVYEWLKKIENKGQ